MFEAALLIDLQSDTNLTAYVSTYRSQPAIFSEFAPEDVVTPYLVFTINSSVETSFIGVEIFTIMLDIYGRNKSRAACRAAANAVKNRLETIALNSSRYDNIRFRFFSGSPVPADDPMDIHYNLQFSARAGRKDWMENFI